MNIDEARQHIYTALTDYVETSLSGDDNAAVRDILDEAWDTLLRHVVPVEWGVYRCDRETGEEIDYVVRGLSSASDAMDVANHMQRVNPVHRYTVGEV